MSDSTPCIYCRGHGWNWQIPSGMNAFAMRMEQITQMSRKVDCSECLGTGSVSVSPPAKLTSPVSEDRSIVMVENALGGRK